MSPGLVFDLDGTLYPERQFIRSGFRAVAAEVQQGEYAASFTARKPADVAADGQARRIGLADAEHPAEVRLLAWPRLQPAAFLVAGGCLQQHGVTRPGIIFRAALRRPRHNLNLYHAIGLLAVRNAYAVGAGIAAADNHDFFAFSVEFLRERRRRTGNMNIGLN